MEKTKIIFLAWKKTCTRSENIANHFNALNYFIYPFNSEGNILKTIARYFISIFITINILFKEKPSVIFSLNQPPFLIVLIFLYAKLCNKKYVLDSHSAAFNDPKWAWFNSIYKIIASKAFFNINTNKHHQKLVESWGGVSYVIGDVPIPIDQYPTKMPANEKSIAVVVSFMFDEPIEEIWGAAKLLPDVMFYVTGNYKKADKRLLEYLPPNIILQGYLSRENYLSLLVSVKAVMVLTTRDFTMQMGAYEAMALEMPIITSDWPILNESFGDGAVYVDNSKESIADGTNKLLEDVQHYKENIKKQKIIRLSYFKSVQREILSKIDEIQSE